MLAILSMDVLRAAGDRLLPSWGVFALGAAGQQLQQQQQQLSIQGCLLLLPLTCVLCTGLAWMLLRLVTFRRWADETRYVPRFLLCFLIMVAELTVENCMVW